MISLQLLAISTSSIFALLLGILMWKWKEGVEKKGQLFLKWTRDPQTNTEFLHQDDLVIAFMDLFPNGDLHFLVVPKKPIRHCGKLKKEDLSLLQHMKRIGKEIAKNRTNKEIM